MPESVSTPSSTAGAQGVRWATPLQVAAYELVQNERKGLSLRTLATDIGRLDSILTPLGKMRTCPTCGRHIFGGDHCPDHR